MKILIKVTKEILAKSAACRVSDLDKNPSYTHCAIALAIREILPKAKVSAYSILSDGGRLREDFLISLPSEATEFIDEFDGYSKASRETHTLTEEEAIQARMNMQPISFEIDVPNEVINQIGISQVYKILSESKTLEHVTD